MNRRDCDHVHIPMTALLRLPLLALACISTACAAPDWRNQLTSPAPGPVAAPPASTVDLKLTWNGLINSGVARIEFAPPTGKNPNVYRVRFSSGSTGAAAVMFPYQNEFISDIDPATFKPKHFQAVEIDGREKTTTLVRHLRDRVESKQSTQSLKKNTTQHIHRSFEFQPTFDIFSAMLLVRSKKLNNGDQMTLALHPLDNPYLLNVKVIGREIHLGRKTIHLSVGLQKIDRKTGELRPFRKLNREASFWISDDAERIPVEFRASAFIGDIRATLTDHRKL